MSQGLRHSLLFWAVLVGTSANAFSQQQSSSSAWTGNVASADWFSTNWTNGETAFGSGQTATFTNTQTPATSTINLGNNVTIGDLVFGNGNWNLASTQGRVLTLTVGTGSTPGITVNNQSVTIATQISGNQGFTKFGTGTLTLSGANNLTGALTISEGALNIRTTNALGDTNSGTVVSSGAALQIQGGITTNAESLMINGTGVSNNGALRNISGNNTFSGAITLGSASTIQSDSGTLTLDVASGNAISATNQNITFSGSGNVTVADSISLGNGSLTKSDGGTLTLSSSNSFSGGTTWGNSNAAGIISIGNNAALGTGTFTVSNAGTVGGNNWIQSSDATARTISNNITVAGSGVNFNTSGSGDLTFSGNVGLGGTSVTTRNFNIVNSRTEFSGTISGAANLGKGSAGTLVLSGANTYTGSTTISGGTLQLGNGGTTGSLATGSAITVNSGGIFSINQSDTVTQGIDFSGAAISGAGGFTQAGTGTTILTAANTYTGNTTVSNGTLQLGNGGTTGSLSASSAISVSSGATFSVNQSDTVTQGVDFSGSAISGQGGFTQAGTGTTVLTAANTYTGPTTVSNGTLQLGNGGTGGSLSTSSTISVASGAAFSVNQSDTVIQGTDFSGAAISGQGGFRQDGTGTTILTAANTYTGATNVNAGTLRINGNQINATGAVTVNNGATLGGSGTVGGATTFQAGSTHSPGNSPGLQTFNAGLTYLSNSSVKWELVTNDNSLALRGQTNGYDGINVNGGPLTIQSSVTSSLVFDGSLNGGTSSVLWTDAFWAANRSWLVYQNALAPNFASASIFDTILISADSNGDQLSTVRAGAGFSWQLVGTNLFLNYTLSAAAVPEPGTWGILCVAAALGLARYKRRKNSTTTV